LSSPVILGFFPFNLSLVGWTCGWLSSSQQPKSQKYSYKHVLMYPSVSKCKASKN
jgi:hypothetical protein